jgi:hypothetical protein
MFPIATGAIVFFGVAAAVAGMVTGLLCGFLFARILKLNNTGIWKDALLGGIGVFVGFFLTISMPWPENTITTIQSDGKVMQSTMHQFRHPFLVAYIFAALLPALHQLYRLRQLTHKCPLITKGS